MSAKKADQVSGRVERLLEIENARVIYRNFSGKITQFNKSGFRKFNVLLPKDQAEELARDGWNIKWLRPQEDGDEPQAHLEVKVQYGRIPPKVIIVSGNNKTPLTEETIGTLDYAEIESVDLVIRPYNWSVNDASGVAAYLKTMWVVLALDPFEHKYANENEAI